MTQVSGRSQDELITETVTFAMTKDDLRILDELVGAPRGRSAWLRKVIRRAKAAQERRAKAAQPARVATTEEARA